MTPGFMYNIVLYGNENRKKQNKYKRDKSPCP